MATQIHVLCANFVKFGWPKIGKVVRYLLDKKNKISARTLALASAWIAAKICQGQLQTISSEYPKFHPNAFTSGGVTAGRVNIVETSHKMFPILVEASSASNEWRLIIIGRIWSVTSCITSSFWFRCSQRRTTASEEWRGRGRLYRVRVHWSTASGRDGRIDHSCAYKRLPVCSINGSNRRCLPRTCTACCRR